jgi:predicted dehydrogenase
VRRRSDYITRSGGIFRDMTIHDFDMARFLLGEEIAAVTMPRFWSIRRSAKRGISIQSA